jgi:hypothetical protein
MRTPSDEGPLRAAGPRRTSHRLEWTKRVATVARPLHRRTRSLLPRAPRTHEAPTRATVLAGRTRERCVGARFVDEPADRADPRRTARTTFQGEGQSRRRRRAPLTRRATLLSARRARGASQSRVLSPVPSTQLARERSRASVAHYPRGRFQLLAPTPSDPAAGMAHAGACAHVARAISAQSDRPHSRARPLEGSWRVSH